MSYFNQVSPEAEELLKEIIDLKLTKSGKQYIWNSSFATLNSREKQYYRDYFRELREAGHINVKWASNIPYFINLTSKGENYFKHKKIEKEESVSSGSIAMANELDSQSENVLQQFIDNTYDLSQSDNDFSILENLQNRGMLKFDLLGTGEGNDSVQNPRLTQIGKTYFEMKEKRLKSNRSIINNFTITTNGSNSPVSAIQGKGSINQNIETNSENKSENSTDKNFNRTIAIIGVVIAGIAALTGIISLFI